MRILSTSTRNYWRNLLRLARGQRLLYPLAATYYVTTRCNLNCSYCEDFGRHAGGEPGLSLAEACQVLAAIRSGTDRLILTGGEPLLYPDIDALVQHARRALGFRLTLLSNASLLAEHESILPHLERLVVSLDTVDPQRWSRVIDAPLPVARTILDNVRAYAGRQREWGFRLILNCVLTPQGLGEAEALLEFCRQHDVLISFSPQAVHNWPHYDLLVSPEYKALLRRLLELKRQGAPILASRAYLRTLLDLTPYSCYPTLIPRVMPNGDLVYPCRPIEKEGDSHGGRPANLLQVHSWAQALSMAQEQYGPPPRICSSCFQQCFAEPSLLQARPLALLHELLRYRASRRGGLLSYAPG